MGARIALNAEDLRRAADWVGKLCPTRPTIPILQGILIEAEDALTLSAFDLETAGSMTVSAGVLEPGRALVPGALLTAIGKSLGARDREIVITCEPASVQVDAGKGNSWTLPSLPVEEYPQLPGLGDPVAAVDGPALRRQLGRVLPAADRAGTQRFASSVAVVGDGDGLTLCATDAHRLATAVVPWKPLDVVGTGHPIRGAHAPGAGAVHPIVDVLASVDFLDAASRAVGGEGDTAELCTDGKVISLGTDRYRLTGRLTSADWPKWRQLIPATWAAQVTFVVDELLSAVGRVLVVAPDEKTPVRLEVSPDGFVLSAIGDDRAGHATAPVSDYWDDDEHERVVAINTAFLRDALRTMESDLAAIRFGPNMRAPLDVVPLDADGEPEPGFHHLVMPMSPDRLRSRSG